jgi:glycosyltransferase involved in cell wall biosynthesis
VGGLDDARIIPLVFETQTLPFPLPGMSDVMPYRSSRFAALTQDELEAYRAAWRTHLRDTLADFRPDVIHSHHYWLLSALVKDVAEDIPVVTHCHGTGFRQLALCPHLADEVRTGCRRNDRFVVLHEGHATVLSEAGISPKRIRVVGSGFRPKIFHTANRPASPGPIVTYAGKLSNAKGVQWLLEAVKRLAERIPELELNVAGSGTGEEAEAIRERIETTNHVVLHNHLDQPDLAELFRRSAVFVLPSFYEGLPLVLVEAAACGCRLVSTALPGVVDQLAPHLGSALELVAPPSMASTDQPIAEDLPAFVERLEQAIEIALGKPAVQAPDQLVVGMTWEAVFQKVADVWRDAISGQASSLQ